jgi:predicted protein tyrosine phosphatase
MKPRMKILFICSQNKKRSPTAEEVYSGYPGVEVRSAGLNKNAEYVLEPEDIQWADLIFVMEKAHRVNLQKHYNLYSKEKRIITLNIPDNFAYMDETLVKILHQKVDKYVL